MKIIDPHIHLFDISKGDYHWLKPDNPPFWQNKGLIYKSFNENDLSLNLPLELSGFVHIEAGFDNEKPHREIQWLESTVTTPFRAIAYLDITLPTNEFLAELNLLTTYSSVVGIRYIIDNDAKALFTQPQVIENLNTLAQYNLLFEAQLSLSQADAINALTAYLASMDNAAPLKVIINHAGTTNACSIKVPNAVWRKSLETLSAFKFCAIKCSGWELCNFENSKQASIDIINLCLHYFGENRVMIASNFPLVLFEQPYHHYWAALTQILEWTSQLKEKILYKNSATWYRFNES